MKKFLTIFQRSLNRSKFILIVSLIIGLVLCVLFNLINNMQDSNVSRISIGIVDYDDSFISKDFISYVENDLKMDIEKSPDIKYLESELTDKNISSIVEIPRNFEKDILNNKENPMVLSFLDDYLNSEFIKSYIDSYTKSIKRLSQNAKGQKENLITFIKSQNDYQIKVNTISVDSKAYNEKNQALSFRTIMGFFLMFSFLLSIFISYPLFEDRISGVYKRIKSTSINTIGYIAGNCVIGFIMSFIMLGVFFTYIGLNNIYIDINLWDIIVLCFTYIIYIIGLSIMVSLLFNSRNAMISSVIGLSTITSILGGCFFPLEYSPQFLQNLARFTPQYWFINALDKLEDNVNSSILINISVITLFAVLFFILSAIRFTSHSSKQTKG